MPLVLHMHGVSRTFDSPGGPVSILKDVSLKVLSGSTIAIRGPSGCGKSTLLYLAGTLDQPTSGLIEILGENPWRMSSSRLASFRNQHIGFIFQDHQLLQTKQEAPTVLDGYLRVVPTILTSVEQVVILKQ